MPLVWYFMGWVSATWVWVTCHFYHNWQPWPRSWYHAPRFPFLNYSTHQEPESFPSPPPCLIFFNLLLSPIILLFFSLSLSSYKVSFPFFPPLHSHRHLPNFHLPTILHQLIIIYFMTTLVIYIKWGCFILNM